MYTSPTRERSDKSGITQLRCNAAQNLRQKNSVKNYMSCKKRHVRQIGSSTVVIVPVAPLTLRTPTAVIIFVLAAVIIIAGAVFAIVRRRV